MILVEKIKSNCPLKKKGKIYLEMLNDRTIHFCSDQVTDKKIGRQNRNGTVNSE